MFGLLEADRSRWDHAIKPADGPQESTTMYHKHQMVPTPEVSSSDVFSQRCPSRPILDLLADKWTALVLFALSGGKKRHGELRRRIGGVSQKMLTQTLRELERYGLVSREVLPTSPPSVEYALTPLGRSLGALVSELCRWTQANSAQMNECRAVFESRKEWDRLLQSPPES
jgi:DNA-binding HxlR family transcriptional regulator